MFNSHSVSPFEFYQQSARDLISLQFTFIRGFVPFLPVSQILTTLLSLDRESNERVTFAHGEEPLVRNRRRFISTIGRK